MKEQNPLPDNEFNDDSPLTEEILKELGFAKAHTSRVYVDRNNVLPIYFKNEGGKIICKMYYVESYHPIPFQWETTGQVKMLIEVLRNGE